MYSFYIGPLFFQLPEIRRVFRYLKAVKLLEASDWNQTHKSWMINANV